MTLPKEKIALWSPCLIALCYIYYCFQPIDGMIGHDYAHALPRIYLGYFHFWQNFLDIPHYSASLCGGIPRFADPQNAYYSMYQWLSFFLDPLKATHLTIIFFYFLGYLGTKKLCQAILKCSERSAHFGALIFVFNGFMFGHLWSDI